LSEACAGLPHDRFRWVGDSVGYWARQAPGRIALSERLATLTYGELERMIDAVRERLVTLGARPGDRILIVLENSVLATVVLLAAARLRAWAVPLNARLSASEVDAIRAHCRPRVSVYAVDVSAEAAAHAGRHGAADDDLLGAVALLSDCAPEPVEDDPAAQVAALIYTSGTVGAPKGDPRAPSLHPSRAC
jgi:acyl-CoA synthetase (AMP-forming)/AMP-acid ligase II